MKKELLVNMLEAQFKLNTKTSGAKWVLGTTNKEKIINWPRTIYLEVAELVESYPYKHWKNIDGKADILNAKIELVDTWHFIMSLSIEFTFYKFFEHLKETHKDFKVENLTDQQILQFWESNVKEAVVDFIENATALEEKDSIYKNTHIEKTKDMTDLNKKLNVFEDLMLNSLMLSTMNIVRTDNQNYYNLVVSILGIFDFILREVEPFDLESIYYGKSVLNSFRQEHGYKEGTYKKMWKNEAGEEVEDNRIMFALVSNGCSIEDLSQELEKHYTK